MKRKFLLGLLTSLLLIGNGSLADETSIDDFAFLAGFGGQSEEVWMPPANGPMFGIFSQYNDGELVFTEFMEITQEDGEFLLRLKHFNPDFCGWEEKTDYVTFRLESVSDNMAAFSGLSYLVNDRRELTISLRMRQGDGSISTEQFNFSRVDL